MTPNVVVVGSANMDLVVRAQRAPGAGETVQGRSLDYPARRKRRQPGGCGRAIGRYNADGMAAWGKDSLGEPVRRNLAENGVDVSQVRRCRRDTARSGYHHRGRRRPEQDCAGSRLKRSALCRTISTGPRRCSRRTRWCYCRTKSASKRPSAPPQVAKDAGARVLWNPAPRAGGPSGRVDRLRRRALAPTRARPECLTGIAVRDSSGARRAAAALVAKGIPNVVITLGKRGALWCNRQEMFETPSFQVPVVDTTAAGDTFAGALGVALAEGQDAHDAMRFACGASALAVTKLGAQPGIPTRAQLEEFLRAEN